ncbi:MAG: ATP-dependent helicase [Acholeplasmataceae bacterium]
MKINLNKDQQKIVKSPDKNIFLLAGAGSGKTRVIVERIKYLINHNIKPASILCITFTNKSSKEMKKRISNQEVSVFTFHSYCYSILKEIKEFKIFEFNNEFTENEILQITNYKNSLKQIKKPSIYERYQKYLKERDLLDYDDLIDQALPLIKNHNYKYIFIDEFQDTNYLQYEIIKKLALKDINIVAVGDPDQAIYSFRGAKVSLIEKFVKDFKAKTYKLEINYRSNPLILKAANNLIKNNLNRYKKNLITNKDIINIPYIYLFDEDIIDLKLVNFIRKKRLINAVILYRNDYQVIKLKQYLKRNYLFFVKLMTFHEAKGLEFNDCIIYKPEILPFDKDNIFSNKEEERRLLFVGITRAINNLYIFTSKLTPFIKETKIKIRRKTL